MSIEEAINKKMTTKEESEYEEKQMHWMNER